jgi:hypothetical protein
VIVLDREAGQLGQLWRKADGGAPNHRLHDRVITDCSEKPSNPAS